MKQNTAAKPASFDVWNSDEHQLKARVIELTNALTALANAAAAISSLDPQTANARAVLATQKGPTLPVFV